jgi:putative FmdB family regulatory protein
MRGSRLAARGAGFQATPRDCTEVASGEPREASREYNQVMPLFEYQCRDCGQAFETFVTGERKAACPGCHGENLAKRLSRPGMVGAAEQTRQAGAPSVGGCGAGGASCACRTAAH